MKWWGVVLTAVLLALLVVPAAAAGDPATDSTQAVVFAEYARDGVHGPAAKPPQGTGVLSSTYSYSGIHWSNPTAITCYINTANSRVTGEYASAAIRAAFQTWDEASTALHYVCYDTTDLVAGVKDGKNVVSWGAITKYPNAIAVTYIWYNMLKHIVEVDTVMNVDLLWSVTPCSIDQELSGKAIANLTRYADLANIEPGSFDVQNIMTHEAGHWIMLGDLYNSKDSKLTMYGYGSEGELIKDTLGYGDELGVERVYGV